MPTAACADAPFRPLSRAAGSVAQVIIWMNGTFGVGKTTTARHLVAMSDHLRLFDPEGVGYMLMNNLADHEFTDFQQINVSLHTGRRFRVTRRNEASHARIDSRE